MFEIENDGDECRYYTAVGHCCDIVATSLTAPPDVARDALPMSNGRWLTFSSVFNTDSSTINCPVTDSLTGLTCMAWAWARGARMRVQSPANIR